MKSITYIDTKTEIIENLETGEKTAIKKEQDRTVKIEQEPKFIKLYLDDICKLNKIPKTGSKLLNELLKCVNYDNEILLPGGKKKEIANRLETSVGVVDNALSKLTKNDIIRRKSVGVYILNPFFFGKGKWTDIKKIRVTWEYGEDMGRQLSAIGIERELLEEIKEDREVS